MTPTPGAANRESPAPAQMSLEDWRLEHDRFTDDAQAHLTGREFDHLLFDLHKSLEIRMARRLLNGAAPEASQ